MKKKQILITVMLIVLTVIVSTPSFKDEMSYRYLRVANGVTMNFGGQCFVIPDKWIIDSVETRHKKRIYNLRTKQGGAYISSSVMQTDPAFSPHPDNLNSIKFQNKEFTIYELTALGKSNEVRYWSSITDHQLLILGTSVDALKNISPLFKRISC
ncbi:MAG TPA: hypothetical protein VEC06_20350 [Paucimonas sp.]|nr:hypothetical protein [Paucimonas sp.]